MLWICQACTTAYSVDAPKCPQCGSADYLEQGGAIAVSLVGEHGPELFPGDDLPGYVLAQVAVGGEVEVVPNDAKGPTDA